MRQLVLALAMIGAVMPGIGHASENKLRILDVWRVCQMQQKKFYSGEDGTIQIIPEFWQLRRWESTLWMASVLPPREVCIPDSVHEGERVRVLCDYLTIYLSGDDEEKWDDSIFDVSREIYKKKWPCEPLTDTKVAAREAMSASDYVLECDHEPEMMETLSIYTVGVAEGILATASKPAPFCIPKDTTPMMILNAVCQVGQNFPLPKNLSAAALISQSLSILYEFRCE